MNSLSAFSVLFLFPALILNRQKEMEGSLKPTFGIPILRVLLFIKFQVSIIYLVVLTTSLVFHGHWDTVVGNSCLWSMLAPLLTVVGHERMLLSAVLYISLYYVTPWHLTPYHWPLYSYAHLADSGFSQSWIFYYLLCNLGHFASGSLQTVCFWGPPTTT